MKKSIVAEPFRSTSPPDQPPPANGSTTPHQPRPACESQNLQDQPFTKTATSKFQRAAREDKTQQQPLTKTAASKFERAFREEEIEHYIELGLGRGVNVTDPDMWKSKTPYLVRKPCKDNIVGTQECGSLEGYKKEVSSSDMKWQKLSFSFGELGASPVIIGLDEQFSKRLSATKVIEGQRIETRTISFQSHFCDASLSANIDQAIFQADENFLRENNLEQDLGNWLKKCREDCAEKELDSNDNDNKFLKLADQLKRDGKLDEVARICNEFVKQRRITHYISAIKLGACEYHSAISRSERKGLGAGLGKGAGLLARVGLSTLFEKYFSIKGEEKRKFGRIDKEREEVTQEAVIDFEIQPLYKLVRVPYIQSLLKKAIEEYIQSKQSE